MNSNPVILSLETATLGGSICVSRGRIVLARRSGDPSISHSNTLLADIDGCLGDATLNLGSVELFACASGPGSFTGLRIGIATLKALAETMQKPCVGVPTLNAVALGAGAASATVALLPAGRGEAFAQMFSVSGEGQVFALDHAMHLSPERIIERYGDHSSLVWAGPWAHLHLSSLQELAGQRSLQFVDNIPGSPLLPNTWSLAPLSKNLATEVSSLALNDFVSGQVQSAETLKAIYVRPSDAEIKHVHN